MFKNNNEDEGYSIKSEVACIAVYSVVLIAMISAMGMFVYFFG